MTRAQEFVLGESNEQLTDQTNLQLSNLIKNDGFKKSYLVAYVYSQKNNYNINKLDKNSNSSSNKSSSSRNRNRNRSNSRSKSSSTA